MKPKELQDRIDKINLLKDLQAGRTCIKTMTMLEQHTFYEMEDGLFHVDGSLLTRTELDAYLKAHPATRVYIYVRQGGNEPLANDDDDL